MDIGGVGSGQPSKSTDKLTDGEPRKSGTGELFFNGGEAREMAGNYTYFDEYGKTTDPKFWMVEDQTYIETFIWKHLRHRVACHFKGNGAGGTRLFSIKTWGPRGRR